MAFGAFSRGTASFPSWTSAVRFRSPAPTRGCRAPAAPHLRRCCLCMRVFTLSFVHASDRWPGQTAVSSANNGSRTNAGRFRPSLERCERGPPGSDRDDRPRARDRRLPALRERLGDPAHTRVDLTSCRAAPRPLTFAFLTPDPLLATLAMGVLRRLPESARLATEPPLTQSHHGLARHERSQVPFRRAYRWQFAWLPAP